MYHDIPYNPLNKRCLAVDACPQAVCNCKSDESCEIKYRTCDQCDVVTCLPNSKPQSGSISGGAVAGAVVSCLVVSMLLAAGIWFLRRRRAARKAEALKRPGPFTIESGTPAGEKPPTLPGTPGSPRTPNANGTRTLHYTESEINLDPFADAHSVHSATSSHVIPIAYVPPNSASMSLADGHARSHLSITSLPPSRPHRSPDLNLKLEPPKSAASRLSTGQELRPPRFSSPYAASQRSGASRASTISSVGSFVYGDTPVVVSQAQGGVRQVLGVARPEVVQVPAAGLASGPPTPGSGTGADLVRSWSQRSKKSTPTAPPLPDFPPQHIHERSPFSPESELGADPFADKENETTTYSVRSVNTFGQPGVPGRDIRASKSPPAHSSTFLAEPIGYDSRPSSIGTVIEGSAQRVMLGTASASTEDLASLPPPVRRASGASVADSILAGFPFVPPSPVGQDHRPGSLAMSVAESFSDPNPPPVPPVPTLSELARQEEQALEQGQAARLPSRHTLGMSTFSSASGVSSSGLEAFPFQFGTGGAPRDSLDTNADVDMTKHVVRASLDTLALSRDVEAFPLPESGYKR
ncbi:unnamed protein product [Rhizoctonia solani]|uniref:Membrane anchor Opy2 N-terminal domain-containing protein n=1 Tax=Rhizoctonia solani TaxID=456999 RepID=A0A8H3CJI3_9AGAM|nr:unnamed protein product [Rhizoctonia solani]